MKLLMEQTENSEKPEPQMGFKPTTLRDLFGFSNHWATGDSGEQGRNVGIWLELHHAATEWNNDWQHSS